MGTATAAASRLRSLAGLAAAVDVDWSDDRLLCAVVDELTSVLGDRSTVVLSQATLDAPPDASSHPGAVQAELEPVLEPLLRAWSAPDATMAGEISSATDPGWAWLAVHGPRECAVYAVVGSGRVVGALAVTRAADREPFTDDDVAFGAALAAVLGGTVQSRRMLGHTMAAVEELRHQAEVIDHISDALITCDADLRVITWNSAAEEIYGYSTSEAQNCDLFALLATEFCDTGGGPIELEDVRAAVADSGQWHGELRERRSDGEPLIVLTSISRGRTGDDGFVLVNRDVTEQRSEEHAATHDPLTGLPNRRMINARMYEAFARACRTGNSMAVLFIDLDGFKPINDRLGHAAGDEVLKIVARRLGTAVRRTDTVGRLGGDEFLVILEDAGDDRNIAYVAHRIIESVAAPIGLEQGAVRVHPSIGVAPAHSPDPDVQVPERLLAAADQAMYVAKQSGGEPVFASLG